MTGRALRLLLAAGLALALQGPPAAAATPFPVAFGGDFSLVDHTGQPRDSDTLRGRLMLVYFGYTECPHSCGMALGMMSAVLDELGAQAAEVAPLFVTVDPAIDTPERLAAYLGHFHPAIVGLTGGAAALDDLRRDFRASAMPVADPGAFDRLVDHSTYLYLLGRDGEPLSLLQPMMPPEIVAGIVRSHL